MPFNSSMYCQNGTESLEKAFGTFVSYLNKENHRAKSSFTQGQISEPGGTFSPLHQ